jgi:hypothetical protein
MAVFYFKHRHVSFQSTYKYIHTQEIALPFRTITIKIYFVFPRQPADSRIQIPISQTRSFFQLTITPTLIIIQQTPNHPSV